MTYRVPVFLVSCAALVVAVACNPDTVPDKPGAPQNGVTVGHHGPAFDVGDPDRFHPTFPKHASVPVDGPSALSGAIGTAVSAWGSTGYFTLSNGAGGDSGAGKINVVYKDGASLPSPLPDTLEFCGTGSYPDSAHDIATEIIGWGAGCTGADQEGIRVHWDSLGLLLTHEIGHALGFNHYTGGITTYCVMSTDEHAFNSALCKHELYQLQYGYGDRPDLPEEGDYVVGSEFSDIGAYTDIEFGSGTPMIGDTLGVLIPALIPSRDGGGDTNVSVAPSGGDVFDWASTLSSTSSSGSIVLTTSGVHAFKARLTSKSGWSPQVLDTIRGSVSVAPVSVVTAVAGTNLDASHLAVSWTNGSLSGGTNMTQVQLLLGATVVANDSFAYGKTADTIAITTDSAYTAQVRHVHNGYAGSWASAAVGTIYPVVSGFTYLCSVAPPITGQNGFVGIWGFSTSPPSGWSYEVWSTDDNVIPPSGTNPFENASGSAPGTSYMTSYISDGFYYPHNFASTLRYFWLRFSNGSAHSPWIAASDGGSFVSGSGAC